MADERITSVSDGRTTHTTISDPSNTAGRSVMGTLAILALVIVIIGFAVYMISMNDSEAVKDRAVSEAAKDVGNAARNVGDAAKDAADELKKQ